MVARIEDDEPNNPSENPNEIMGKLEDLVRVISLQSNPIMSVSQENEVVQAIFRENSREVKFYYLQYDSGNSVLHAKSGYSKKEYREVYDLPDKIIKRITEKYPDAQYQYDNETATHSWSGISASDL